MVVEAIDNYQLGQNDINSSLDILVLIHETALIPVEISNIRCLISPECEVSLICQLITWLQKENRPISDCKLNWNEIEIYYDNNKKIIDHHLNIDTNKQSRLGIAYKFCDDDDNIDGNNKKILFESPKFIVLKVIDKTNISKPHNLPFNFIITQNSTIKDLQNNIMNLCYNELFTKNMIQSHIIVKFHHLSINFGDDYNKTFKDLGLKFNFKNKLTIEIKNIQIINKTDNSIINNYITKHDEKLINYEVLKKFNFSNFNDCIESIKNGTASEYPNKNLYNNINTTLAPAETIEMMRWSKDSHVKSCNDPAVDQLFNTIEKMKSIGVKNNNNNNNNTTNYYENDNKTINNNNNININNNNNNNNNNIIINNLSSNNYVGLVNQAMTCYLNSLLQALYMTPEFRNALYNWEYVDVTEKDEAKSIPYQLQKLFLNLQTSDKNSVKTTSLTKSFGWDSTEAWHQHDIQELCRVMFDALEQTFKNTKQSDLINRLYEGKMIDYVKCLTCKTIKSREDTFLDIPLPVRPFGCNVAYNDVQEALRAFVQPETLDGVNQYYCEKCNKKTDAHKGLKFKKFPYLLTLHLKRFDFDYNTLQRIKLNDKVSFPDELNLNSFVIDDNNDTQESSVNDEDAGVGVKCDDSSTNDLNNHDELLISDSVLSTATTTTTITSTLATPPSSPESTTPPLPQQEQQPIIATTTSTINTEQDDDEGIDMSNGPSTSSTHSQDNDKCHIKGPYNYELYAIMIHSGSASGGHYYAYIKDFKTNQWLCFNDQDVSSITQNDIQKTFGGGPTRGFYSGYYGSSTNAYMLMYRQIDNERNALPMTIDNFPKHIKELLKKIKNEDDENKLSYYRTKSSLTSARVSCIHPIDNIIKKKKIYFFEDETLKKAIEHAYKELNLENIIDIEQCRLVSWDPTNEFIKHSYDEKNNNDKIADVLEKNDEQNSCYELLLEIRDKNKLFKNYLPNAFKTTIYIVDYKKYDIIDGPFTGRALYSQKISDLKNELANEFSINYKNIICAAIVRSHTDSVKILDDDNAELKTQGFIYDVNAKILLIQNDNVDDDNNKYQLNMKKLTKLANDIDEAIYLKINLPDMSKEKLDEMNIKLIDEYKNYDNDCNHLNNINNNIKKCIDSGDNNSTTTTNNNNNNIINGNKDTNGTTTTTTTENDELQEQSNSEDSSQSDSDRTLVGNVSEEEDDDNDNDNDSTDNQNSNKETDYKKELLNIELKKYFKVTKTITDENGKKYLKLLVDKNLKIQIFKIKLEKFIGISKTCFKLEAEDNDHIEDISYSNKYDDNRIGDKINNNTTLNMILLRVLGNNEIKIKLYKLNLNQSSSADSSFQYLFDIIGTKNMTIKQLKNIIVSDMKTKMDTDISIDNIRLRHKIHQQPSKVYFNHQLLHEICKKPSIEIVLQILDGVEQVIDNRQIIVIVKCSTGIDYGQEYQEIILSSAQATIEELTEKISELSGIPGENLEFTSGNWPLGQSQRSGSLKWTSIAIGDDVPALYDGAVIYYKDAAKQSFIHIKRDITDTTDSVNSSKDNRTSSTSTYRRREHALKIYVHQDTD